MADAPDHVTFQPRPGRKPKAFTMALMKSAARIARDVGVGVRLEASGAITFLPHPASQTLDISDEDDLDRELREFEARKYGHG